jgi:predicted Zn finger-like uncharacterized protein
VGGTLPRKNSRWITLFRYPGAARPPRATWWPAARSAIQRRNNSCPWSGKITFSGSKRQLRKISPGSHTDPASSFSYFGPIIRRESLKRSGIAMSSSPDRSCVHDRDQASVLEVSCPNCKRGYRIRRCRIPAQASAVICKNCGRKIRLHQTNYEASSASRNQWTMPRFRLDLMTPEKRPLQGRLKRKNA